jgi:hypothetical protein
VGLASGNISALGIEEFECCYATNRVVFTDQALDGGDCLDRVIWHVACVGAVEGIQTAVSFSIHCASKERC